MVLIKSKVDVKVAVRACLGLVRTAELHDINDRVAELAAILARPRSRRVLQKIVAIASSSLLSKHSLLTTHHSAFTSVDLIIYTKTLRR